MLWLIFLENCGLNKIDMAPLVPQIIGDEFNFVIAFIIGIAFGFILEQAGFSSTKKLVGLFYGYDFTVLRVFFTAGVTAMAGVLILGHLGLLDLSVVYVNPTFLWSAIVGGLIMGAGFVIGGFCPGTSVCAAAIGKLDAMFFIVGSFIGIFIFIEGFPLWEEFYHAENWGAVRINEFFNISASAFAFLLAAVAIIAFVITSKIESRINSVSPVLSKGLMYRYAVVSLMPFLIISIVAFTPDRTSNLLQNARMKAQGPLEKQVLLQPDQLAYEITNDYLKYTLLDLRDTTQYRNFNIATSINIPFKNVLDPSWDDLFDNYYKTIVLYGDTEEQVKTAYHLLKKTGKADFRVLNSSAEEFRNLFYNSQLPEEADKKSLDIYKFRKDAASKMEAIRAVFENDKPKRKKTRKIQGGCS